MMFADFSNSHGHSTPSISSIDGTRFVIAQDSSVANSDLALPFAADAPLRSLADFATAGQTLTPETMLHVRDARVIFANYGAVERANVVRDRETGQPRGFAFIEMTNRNEAMKAIQGLDGQDMNGRAIKGNEARAKEERGNGGGGGGGNRSGGGGGGRRREPRW